MKNENKYIPSGMHVERNKFRLNQRTENEALDLFKVRNIEIYEDFIGMNLTRAENKALLAVQEILNNRTPLTNHKINSTEFPSRLKFSLSEYYDAYGVGKRKTARGWMDYNARESKLALKNLHSLASKPRQFFYKRVRWTKDKEGKKERLTSFRAFIGTLINFTAGFNDLKDSEVQELKKGRWTRVKTEERADMDIGLSVIITDQMKDYYVLIPTTLYDDIKQITPSRSGYIPLFIEWLIVQAELKRRNEDTRIIIEIDEIKLARTLRMDYLVRTGRRKEIRKKLNECYEIASRLGYLSNALADEEVHKLTLNPEKYPYWNDMIKRTQKLWHKKEYKRKKAVEKRLKSTEPTEVTTGESRSYPC